jgi:hypothetical protein
MPGFCSLSALGGGAVIGTRDISAQPAPAGIYQTSRPGEGRPEPIRQARSTPGPGPHCGAPFAPFAPRARPSIGSPGANWHSKPWRSKGYKGCCSPRGLLTADSCVTVVGGAQIQSKKKTVYFAPSFCFTFLGLRDLWKTVHAGQSTVSTTSSECITGINVQQCRIYDEVPATHNVRLLFYRQNTVGC